MNVVRMDTGLEEGVGHVHLAEDLSLPTVGEYVINTGWGEVVSSCVGVESSVVIYPLGIDS
jgi:hypothetical protein